MTKAAENVDLLNWLEANQAALTALLGGAGDVPIGTIIDYAGAGTPAGCLVCAGAAVSRATYAALFAAIGITWGPGDGSTTFNLPDLRRRTTIGAGGAAIAAPGVAVGAVNSLLTETHTLSELEMPAHVHGYNSDVSVGGLSSFNAGAQVANGNTSVAGGGGPHNNMQPSAVVTKVIRAI